MDDPWEQIPFTVTGTIPRWVLEQERLDFEDPTMTADEVVSAWVENMEENQYDIARDDGRLPVTPLGEQS